MQLSLLYRWLAEAGLLLGKEPAPGILRTINGYGRIWFPSSAVLTLYNGGLFHSAGTKYVAHCTPHRSLQLRNDLSLKSRSFQCNKGLPSEGHQSFPETAFFKLYGIWQRKFFTSCLYFLLVFKHLVITQQTHALCIEWVSFSKKLLLLLLLLLLPVQTKFKAQGVGVNIVYPFSHPPTSLSSLILQLVFLMSCFIPLDAWEEFSFFITVVFNCNLCMTSILVSK